MAVDDGDQSLPGMQSIRAGVARAVARVALAALGLGPVLTSVAGAQQAAGPSADAAQRVRIQPPWRLSVRADNDAFNFWRAITDRPDKEYTNGDQVILEISGAPWWGKRFAKRRALASGFAVSGIGVGTLALPALAALLIAKLGWRDAYL